MNVLVRVRVNVSNEWLETMHRENKNSFQFFVGLAFGFILVFIK